MEFKTLNTKNQSRKRGRAALESAAESGDRRLLTTGRAHKRRGGGAALTRPWRALPESKRCEDLPSARASPRSPAAVARVRVGEGGGKGATLHLG